MTNPTLLRSRSRPSIAWTQRTRSDGALLVAIGRADQGAVVELYRRHGAPVYAVARPVCGPKHAEVVTRALFLRLWTSPQEYLPGRESLRSCLLSQAHSDAVGLVARASLGMPHLGENPARSLLGALPPDQAKALALVVFGGRTFLEAAALLDEPELVVRRSVVRGFQALGAALRESKLDAAS